MRKRVRAGDLPAEAAFAGAWARAGQAPDVAVEGGGTLRVRYPGRPNPGPGPDFLDAILETPGGEVRGAVEVHRRSSDWARHGHGADPRYRDVVLHVVGQDDGGRCAAPGGRQLPLLVIGADPQSWPADAGPGAPDEVFPFPCAARGRRGESHLPLLVAAGEARFAAAAARLGAARERALAAAAPAGRFEAGEQAVFEEVAAALGYEHNTAPLRALAGAAPLVALRSAGPAADPLLTAALLLGTAGLLPSQRHLPLARRRGATTRALESAWRRLDRAPALRAYRWVAGGRPENAPVRRVLALAGLVRRWPSHGLLEATGRVLESEPRAQRAARLLSSLVVTPPAGEGAGPGAGGGDYWRRHWDFGVPARTGAGALLGPSRAADVVVNVLLPLAAGEPRWRAAARRAYLAHPPLAGNWITRLVGQRAALSGPLPAAAQQGLIAVYEATCRDLRCGACPLATGEPPEGAPSVPSSEPGSSAVAGDGRAESGRRLAGDALQRLQLGVAVAPVLGAPGEHPQADQLAPVRQGQDDSGAAVG
jgi:hypothetical protein